MKYKNFYNSPLGKIVLVSSGEKLSGVYFENQKYLPQNIKDLEVANLPIFDLTKKWLDVYFSGKCPNFTLPLDIDEISPFRKKVSKIMLTIPYGEVITYGLIAKQIERKTNKRVSAQAVGGAVGHNAISIIIPCHRVIGTNKKLTGYAGGLDKKIELLKIEKVDQNKYKF